MISGFRVPMEGRGMLQALQALACVLMLWAVTVRGDTTNTKFKHHYMSQTCNKHFTDIEGTRFETHTALTYDRQMSCTTTFTAPPDKKFHIVTSRFELEDSLAGICVDSFNLHDGVDTSAPSLTGAPICGTNTDRRTYVTRGRSVTFVFKSDENANYKGFEFVVSAYRDAPCVAGEFSCNNSRCVDMSLECDHYDQCGDNSDEDHCTVFVLTPQGSEINPAIILGGVVGFILLCIIVGYIVYRIYQYCQNEAALKDIHRYAPQYEYPVTDRYSKYEKEMGRKGRRDPDLKSYMRRGEVNHGADSDNYLDEH